MATNPTSLFKEDPVKGIMALIGQGVAIPQGVLVKELSRSLGSSLYSYLNNEGDPLAPLFYSRDLLLQWGLLGYHNCAEASELADKANRVFRFRLKDELTPWLAQVYKWKREVLHWLHKNETEIFPTVQKSIAAKHLYDQEKYKNNNLYVINEFYDVVIKEITPYCKEFLIHGSLSDFALTNYSDLDTWMLISENTVCNPETLQQLKNKLNEPLRLIKTFDPLQHHGIFVCTELDLLAYQESTFPLVLFDSATSLMDCPELTFNCTSDKMESYKAFKDMAKNILNINEAPSDPFNIKMLTSWILFLPTLYHQLEYDYTYKPDSFEKIKPLVGIDTWKAIERATLLRNQWGTESSIRNFKNDNPDFLDKAHLLAKELYERAQCLEIKDPLWEKINLNNVGANPPAADHPIYYSNEEFIQCTENEIARYSEISGIRSIYSLGSFSCSTPGISDLDLLVVLENDPLNDASAKESYTKIIESRTSTSPKRDRYIKWHEDVILSKDELVAMAAFWIPPPQIVWGKDDIKDISVTGADKNISNTILLYEIGYFQLIKLIELYFIAKIPLRLSLLRCFTLKYDIKIAKNYYGISHPIFSEFTERITNLRNNWFTTTEEQRRKEIVSLIPTGITILTTILSSVSLMLKNKGVVTTENFSQVENYIQKLGFVKVQFCANPTKEPAGSYMRSRNRALEFPLAMMPLVYHCRPFARFDPTIDVEIFDRSISEPFRRVSKPVKTILEKYLTLEEDIKQLIKNKTRI